jgi:carbon-monoxide dehydrogenase small subunit
MSGNLCRCTGYLGIVRAVHGVLEQRRTRGAAAAVPPAAPAPTASAFTPFVPSAGAPAAVAAQVHEPTRAGKAGWTRFEESFVVHRPPPEVWRAFADLPMVAACLPGAELAEQDGTTAKGKMVVKLGPIVARFAGSASIERDDAAMSGLIRGAGADGGTGSRTRGDVTYRLAPEAGGTATRVFVTVEYSLQGALAQFSRSNIAQDLGRRLVAEFAARLDARLGGAPAPSSGTAPAALDAGGLIRAWLADWLRRLFGRNP